MPRHFLRYVRQEDWFPFLKYSGCRAGEQLLDNTSRRLCRTAFTVGCSTIALETSSRARYRLVVGANPSLSSGMRIRLAPAEPIFHVETV
jgi:hypothetical protein